MPLYDRLLVAGVALLWGFNFVVIRWGLEDTDPYIMTALRFIFVAFPLIFIVRRPAVRLWIVALYGLMFGIGIWGLVNIAIFLGTPAGSASLLLQLSAFLSVIAGLIFFQESLTRLKALGIGVAFCGFALVVIFRSGSVPLTGIAIVFLAAIFWTLCNMLIRFAKPDNVLSFVVWSSLFVPIPILMIPLYQHYMSDAPTDFLSLFVVSGYKGWISILFQAFLTTLVGYSIWVAAIAKHGLVNVAPFTLLVPIAGLFFGYFIYDEAMSRFEIMGAVLILLGLVLLSVQLPQATKRTKRK